MLSCHITILNTSKKFQHEKYVCANLLDGLRSEYAVKKPEKFNRYRKKKVSTYVVLPDYKLKWALNGGAKLLLLLLLLLLFSVGGSSRSSTIYRQQRQM
jgi:hypothetical protein